MIARQEPQEAWRRGDANKKEATGNGRKKVREEAETGSLVLGVNIWSSENWMRGNRLPRYSEKRDNSARFPPILT